VYFKVEHHLTPRGHVLPSGKLYRKTNCLTLNTKAITTHRNVGKYYQQTRRNILEDTSKSKELNEDAETTEKIHVLDVTAI
jgi:hypothetical protein